MGSTAGGNSKSAGRKEADLNKREAELNRREAELRRLELEIRNNPGAKSTKNWPKFCPVLHHDIAGEIPAQSQIPVRRAYWAYLVSPGSGGGGRRGRAGGGAGVCGGTLRYISAGRDCCRLCSGAICGSQGLSSTSQQADRSGAARHWPSC